MRRSWRRGQSFLEYATLMAATALAVGGLSVYIMRSAKANLANLEDELNGAVQEKPGAPPGATGKRP